MKLDNEHIELLISRYLLGEASADERQEVDEWRNASPENELQFIEMQKTLDQTTSHLIGDSSDTKHIDIDMEWSRFQNTIGAKQKQNQKQVIPLQSRLWLRIAAAVILIAVIGFAALEINKSSGMITYYADSSGETIELPDGSTIVMNANSELTYPKKFTENSVRRIRLSGEAFFDVSHDPASPFVVELEGASVQVLGTSFNIEAYESIPEVKVVVASGKVKLATEDDNSAVVLSKGDRGTYVKSKNQVIQETNTDVNYLAWKTGRLVFNDVSLAQVVETLNKLYEINLTISTDTAGNCRVTVSFDQQSIEAILSVLEATLDLTYSQQGNNIEIVQTGC